MKNYKRAERRYQKHVKFIKRLKQWIKPGVTRYLQRNEFGYPLFKHRIDTINEALKGQCYTFLRTTGNPCNCSMCQYDKYARLPKQKIMKEVWKEIEDDDRLKKLSYFKTN